MNASQWHWMAILFIFHTQISCFHVAASLTLNSTSDEFTISDKDSFQQGIPVKIGKSEFTDAKVKKHESIKNRELNDLQGSCTFNAMPLNLQNQFETDLIEYATEGAFALGGVAASTVPVVGPILSSFVFPLAGAVTAGQMSARYATDPNEDRFTALENFASCITKEFDLVWKRLEELAKRMNRSQFQKQREFFQINVQKLQDQKNVLFVNYMKDVKHCLLSDGSKFLNSGSECGKDKIVDLTSDIFEHVVKDFGAVLDAAAILYKDTGVAGNNPYSRPYFPMFGDRIEINSFPSGDTANNDGFEGIYVPKLDYTDMRTFLSEITYQANTNILILAQVREWATARELYRNPYVFSFSWFRIIKTAEDISKSLQSLIDSLMYSSEETGNLPVQRILTSDTLNERVFCINFLKLKSNAPDWCKNKEPFGWIWDEHMPNDIGWPACDDSYSRGCWIGDGECSLNNFKDICIDLSESSVDNNDYPHMCALNEVPQLPVDNSNYDDIGPMTWAYVHGAPVDPLINNINEMREAVAYANAFVSYWKKEEHILETEIKIGCNGQSKETLGPSNYSFDACPRPSSCITCSGTQGSECAYETITDAQKCGTYTVMDKGFNGCFCKYNKETYYMNDDCNAHRCGTERVKVGEKCGGFCCCFIKYPVYETRAKCCTHGPYTRWVLDTCTFPKTCIVADECTCRTKECDGESFDITTGQEK